MKDRITQTQREQAAAVMVDNFVLVRSELLERFGGEEIENLDLVAAQLALGVEAHICNSSEVRIDLIDPPVLSVNMG